MERSDLRLTDCSVVLDVLRASAAQMVCFGHAINFFNVYPGLKAPNFPYLQVLGVLIFFILSGFVIAYTLSRTQSFEEYFIDRVSRIYTAYLPAIMFVVVVDSFLIYSNAYDPQYRIDLVTIVGNVIMLEMNQLGVANLGSAQPFWTIAVEFHIYLFIGALFFLKCGRLWLLVPIAMLMARLPLSYLFGAIDSGVGLFSLWLMGFSIFFLAHNLERLPTWVVVLFGLVSMIYFLFRTVPGNEYSPKLYPALAVAFLALVTVTLRSGHSVPKLQQVSRFFAGYSFSLYLIHFTIIYAIVQFWSWDKHVGMWFSFFIANLIGILFSYLTERHYRAVATVLKSCFLVSPSEGFALNGLRKRLSI